MFLIFHLLAQAQQPPRLQWALLVLFALLAVAAVGLLIYFLTRVRKSEKEAEEDWGLSSRGILLTPTAPRGPEAHEKSETPPPEVTPGPKEAEPPVIAAFGGPSETELTAESPAEPEVALNMPAPVVPDEPAQIVPESARGQGELKEEPTFQVEPQLQPVDQTASPFDEDVWSELQHPEPTGTPGEVVFGRPSEAGIADRKEPYEPPRIDAILPRNEPSRKGEPTVPGVSYPASASQQSPPSRARLDAPPARLDPPPPKRERGKPAPGAAPGSILGLPAEGSTGPFILGKSRAQGAAVGVGTLSNYDKPPDDATSHSGTIALIVVIVIVCGSLAAYFALPPIHSRVDTLVARIRGEQEPPKIVAQLFPAPYDNTKDPIQVRGTLQNTSDQSLYGLVVTVSLQRKDGGAATTEAAQVIPEEVLPNQQGSYEFQIDAKTYKGYRVVGLKNKDGVELGYVKPNQQQ
jgi:hypothetical protein